eukprot:1151484-Pelagomonas_calceolata.AAC.10
MDIRPHVAITPLKLKWQLQRTSRHASRQLAESLQARKGPSGNSTTLAQMVASAHIPACI